MVYILPQRRTNDGARSEANHPFFSNGKMTRQAHHGDRTVAYPTDRSARPGMQTICAAAAPVSRCLADQPIKPHGQ
jgi:hypothetical protein